MTPVSKIIELLTDQLAFLELIKERQLTGYAIIVPPTGEPIIEFTGGSHDDEKAFYNSLATKFLAAKEQSQFGGVNVPGMRR